MSKPIQTSDIIFPVLSTDFSTTLSSLKRSTLSISNRLRSISEDAKFVCAVADAYKRPLVANERCGSWYIPLERKAASAYFKSTDGHTGECSFSLRRLNIQVLELVGQHDGCVIVDSTRRGKRMPDALSKTIPIWCAIWNALLFPDTPAAHALHTPHNTVSPSEHAQIGALLPAFLASARALNLPVLPRLRAALKKPLRPLWVTRDSPLPASAGEEEEEEEEESVSFADFHPVICCTASRRVPGGEASEGGYVQGAGDDSEGWARGLTAPLFWAHCERLLSLPEAELPSTIAALLVEEGGGGGNSSGSPDDAVLIAPTDWLYVCPLAADAVVSGEGQFDAVIACAEGADEGLRGRLKCRYLHLKCGTGKLGSRDLRGEIPKIEAFMRDGGRVPAGGKLAVCCQTGKDISVGVALAVLCLYADEDGNRLDDPNDGDNGNAISKNFIRQRLSWIMTAFPAASPSRATLQSVNAFLFSPREKPPAPPRRRERSLLLARTFSSLSTASNTTTPWTLARTLTSALPSTTPSGTFAGTATFVPRAPTAPGYAAEYLYAEEGTLRTTDGLEFPARRRYVWRYKEKKDAAEANDGVGEKEEEEDEDEEGISVWFVKEDGETVDYLFLDMEFEGAGRGEVVEEEEEEEEEEGKGLKAKGRHPCGEDMYDARFEFGGGDEERRDGMTVTYVVKGPRKDYVSETRYTR